MITIDLERCTGCGACVEACPTGALYLVDNKAAMDGTFCRECEICLDVCAAGAIALAPQLEPAAEPTRLPAQQPEPEVIRVRTPPAPVPLRAKVLPVVGAALTWAGREIVPHLVDILFDTLDRQTTGKQTTARRHSNGTPSQKDSGRGRPHRHRRRGNW